MPPSPYKRDRRMKSRLTAGSEDERVSLRQKALEMMNRRGGPVDKASPDAQKQAAQQVQGAKQGERDQQARRSFTLHRNATGNARAGGMFRTIHKPGGDVHDYPGSQNDVFVKKTPESGGTGNHAGTVEAMRTTDNPLKPVERVQKRSAASYDGQLNDLARQRMSQSNRGRRKLFARKAA